MGDSWPASALWDYALDLYARPAVREACLALQDRAGADVNLLLLACWLGATGRRPDAATLARIRAEALAWQDAVVRPLRVARRELKRRLPELDPALRGPLAAARASLAEVELATERAELLTLEAVCGPFGPGAADAAATAEVMRHVAALDEPDLPGLRVLLAATFPTLLPKRIGVLARIAAGLAGKPDSRKSSRS
jgi:uncharacterized protein (TIGR02444 family)